MKKLFIAVLLLTTYNCFSQQNEFKEKLAKFRFSLNPLFEKYDATKVQAFNFSKSDSITIVIDEFVDKHTLEIRRYQKELLLNYSKNGNASFNMNEYTKADVNRFNQQMNEKDISALYPLSKLLWINPLSELETYRDMYLMSKWTNVEIGAYLSKLSICTPLIETKKLDEDHWEIVENTYDIIIKAHYDMNKSKVTNIEVYERLPSTSH